MLNNPAGYYVLHAKFINYEVVMILRRLVLFVLCLLPLSAFAGGKTALDTLKDAQGRAEKLLSTTPKAGSPDAEKRKKELEKEARALFDFEELAKRALGKNWDAGTAEQQKEFVTLFSKPIVENYLSQLEGRSSKGFTLTWGEESKDDKGNTFVSSNVKGKTAEGKPVDITVKYFVIQKNSNWIVYDVVTDDSSVVAVQKDTFKKMFKTHKDFNGVLEQLRNKVK
jgi:phospholipid transport system substrate-binding protein